MSNDSGGGSFRAGFFGLVLGAATGFALGMMLAPEEGRKLRRRLAFHLDAASQRLGDLVESFGDEGELSEARQKGQSLVADIEERAKKIQDDMDQLLSQVPQSGAATR